MGWVVYSGSDQSLFRHTVRARQHTATGTVEVLPIAVKKIDEHLLPDTDGMYCGSKEEVAAFMQAMMDSAYSMGLRPSAAQDERHMQAHLNDMRKIAFKALGVS